MRKTSEEKKNVREKGKGSRPSSRDRWMLIGARRGNLIGAEYVQIREGVR